MGQKRYFLRDFTEVLEMVEGKIDTVVDLFGGSGLLSHTAKRVLPGCRVIYNDFDHYDRRLAAVEQTNEILRVIKDRLTGVEPNRRLTEQQRADVLAIVEGYERRSGYVDILTIGRNVLFSGTWVTSLEELRKHTMYNRVRPGGYECAGYLDGLEVVHMDYRELFERERGNSRALFVLDPPYLTTECGMYENYWKLTDYLDVLRLLKGTKYVYFTSDKSQIVELCQWLADEYREAAPMWGAEVRQRTNTLNYQAKFNDMMITRL
ncbi:DNA adenine methylase [Paramuribaculum intestinale]|uniref:DNA adenine methylase n=1 Tax=Paramuribaculum intestinale TaxID=2094151 RepID=UPI00263825B3|nr:DNA adenine methylase [Paramuribaculum intestinale]